MEEDRRGRAYSQAEAVTCAPNRRTDFLATRNQLSSSYLRPSFTLRKLDLV